LAPVLLSSTKEPTLEDPESGLLRCPQCRARITQDMEHCPACRARLGAPEEDRPWEDARGTLRRDCEPHRGPLILILGRLSLCLVIPGLLGVAFIPFTLASLLGTGIGLTVVVMSKDDLDQMRSKVMDPAGKQNTMTGQTCGSVAMVIGIVGLVLAGLIRLHLLFAL
jgi:fatty acid desaturase